MPPRPASMVPGYPAYQPPQFQLLRAVDFPELDRSIAIYPAAQTVNAVSINVNVRTPNVRVRTRVVFALVPTASTVDTDTALNTTMLGGTGTLWGAIVQRVRDNTRKSVPVQDVAGTKAAPLAIPTNAGLWGYALEIETCGDDLQFIFSPPLAKAGNTVAGAWHVLVNYEAVQRLSDEEWQQMRQGGAIDVGAPVVLT